MSAWTLNDTPAADLGVASIRLQRSSQRTDECLLRVSAPFDGAAIFTHGSTVTLKKDDDTYFVGRCDRDPRAGNASSEQHDVSLLGPWWYLENRIFRQAWTQITNPETTPPTTAEIATTYVILGMAQDGTRQTTGTVMAEAIDFAIASGAPMQLGTIMAGVQVPLDECNDITCAEVLHRCLRWTPDAVVWFDYSTSPYPSINISRRADLTASSLPASTGSGSVKIVACQCAPCWSLKIDGVRLYFTVDSNPFPSVIQSAGTLTGFQVMECTIRLGGSKQTLLLNKVEVIELPSDPNDATFWMNNVPWLHSVDALTLHDGDLDNFYDYPNQLLSGTITDWMLDHQGKHVFDCVATVKANYTLGGTNYYDQEISFKYKATDAASKVYTWGEGGTPAEVPPTGLATAILAACSTLHYEGNVTVVAAECGLAASVMGTKLNLTGGLAAWASMNALIVSTTEDLFSGRTTVVFGPPPCLGVGDMKSLAQMNRIRVPAGSAGAKKSGSRDASNSPTVGGAAPTNTGFSGMPQFAKFAVTSTGETPKTVTIDPATPGTAIEVVTGVSISGTDLVFSTTKLVPMGDVLVADGDGTDITIAGQSCDAPSS